MPEVNYKVGLIGKLDMLKFKNMPKVRNAAIDASPSTPLKGIEPTNEKAKAHHPKQIEFVIDDILQIVPYSVQYTVHGSFCYEFDNRVVRTPRRKTLPAVQR